MRKLAPSSYSASSFDAAACALDCMSTCAQHSAASSGSVPAHGPTGQPPSCVPLANRSSATASTASSNSRLRNARSFATSGEGGSNCDVAAQLLISPRTVEHPTLRRPTRNGVSSRTQLLSRFDSLRRLENLNEANPSDHVIFWQLLASHGRKEEARDLANG